MRARTRRGIAFVLACSIAGCHALTVDTRTITAHEQRDLLGRAPAPLARVTYEAPRDLLRIVAGDEVAVRAVDVRDMATERVWDWEYFSLTDGTADGDDFSLTLILLPITLPIDVCLPFMSLLVTPVIALFQHTSTWTTRTPVEWKEERPWPRFDLVDPATQARLTVTSGAPLRARDLALLGFRSAALQAVSPGGEQRLVTLPPAAVAHLSELQRATEALRAGAVVLVPPGTSLADAARRAAPGAWLQLEAGEYELPGSVFLYGAKLTIAGRGAGRTILTSRGRTGFDLRGASQQVTLRGVSLRLVAPEVSDGVRVSGGEVRLVACEVSGARHQKVELPPEERAKQQGDSYRGGVGVWVEGSGKTRLEGCRLFDNMSASALAVGSHTLEVLGCEATSGALEAVSFRGGSSGFVRDSALTGPGHGVLVTGTASAGVYSSDIQVSRAGVLAQGEGKLNAVGNTVHGCATGVSVEGAASGTVADGALRGNGAGVLVSSTGSVTVSANTCTENTNGISVQQAARPTLTGNTCQDNKGSGILYTGTSAGVARRNTLERNGSGIAVQGQATPLLESNTAKHNRESGLFVSDTAAPRASSNTLAENREGVHVQGQGRPDAGNNTLEDNHAGLVLVGQAAGSYHGNTIRGNSGPGVVNQSGGRPTLVNNTVSGNNPDFSR